MKKKNLIKGKELKKKCFLWAVAINDEYELAIVNFSYDLQMNLIEKYREGKRVHGNKKPTKLDCQREINLEVLDILNYHLIDKVNSQNKPLHSSQSSRAMGNGARKVVHK